MVSDYPGNVRVFPTDADGQHAPSVPVAQNYGLTNALGLAMSGGRIFMAQQANSRVVELNASGTFNQVIASLPAAATGIATNPINGHLYVSAGSAIYEIDPATNSVVPIVTSFVADGLTVNASGSILYAAGFNSQSIIGFDTLTHATVFDSGFVPGQPDGIAIGASGPLAGKIYVNTNGGELIEIDLATKVQLVMLTGGSRGDFVSVDPYNGTLLITQTDQILRLTPINGGFEGATTPLPATLPLFVSGLGALVFLTYLKKRKQAV
jgi:sugar lactone lactonase YvrE